MRSGDNMGAKFVKSYPKRSVGPRAGLRPERKPVERKNERPLAQQKSDNCVVAQDW